MAQIVLVVFMTILATVSSFQLNIVEVFVGQSPTYGYPVSAPVFDVTFERLEKLYPQLMANYTRKRIYKPGIISCSDAAVTMITFVVPKILEYFNNLNGFNILISPGCSLEIVVLGDIGRELGFPVFSSIGSDPVLANNERFPTTLAYGTLDYESMALSVKALIDKFAWKNIMLLCDAVSNAPGTNSFYLFQCTNTKKILPVSGGQYIVKSLNIDSADIHSFDWILDRVKEQGRVVIVFTHPSVLRRILVNASRKNMTSGDYVYLAPIRPLMPTTGNMSWQYQDSDDETALEAFKSLIFYTTPNPNYEGIRDISEARRRMSINNYKLKFTNEELYNDLAIDAYETVTTMIQVLNESYLTEGLTTMEFCRLFLNRTFTLPSRSFYLNRLRMRVSDVEYYQVDETSREMKQVWHYYSRDRRLEQVLNNISWRGGRPPLDTPICGFKNDRCLSNNFLAVLQPAVGSAIGVLAILMLMWMIARQKIIIDKSDSIWWYLNDEDNDMKKNEEGSAESFSTYDQYSFKITQQKGHHVWVESITCQCTKEHVTNSQYARDLFKTVKNFNHLNISVLHGIFLLCNSVQLVYERHQRGSLRDLLTSDNHFENSLQRSIIWEILDGINYIHISKIGCHGNISPMCIFLDKRFTIKICGYATKAFCFFLTGQHSMQITEPGRRYLPPEYLADGSTAPTKSGDVYSVSVIALEVTDFIPGNNQSEPQWRGISDVLEFGQTRIPSERPSLKQLITSLKRILPRDNMLEGIMLNLEQQATELEFLIEERSAALMIEQEKSDALLKTMIPPKFVNALRNNRVIPAEQFDCVTVMFSDLPGFEAFCSRSTPMEVTTLLNTIYMTLDDLIVSFDVYKVETIRDSYMVASGLPERNGDQHVAQIALLSQKFMDTFESLEIMRLIDKSVKLRIGFHSGPCAAGVVGLRMPRYCLFGDTINTASRMERYGEASRIHLSYEAKVLLEKLGGFDIKYRGKISIKGKGNQKTFWLVNSEL